MAKLIINEEKIPIRLGETIFAHADGHPKVLQEIASSCHRHGTCRECIIEIKSGSHSLSPRTPKENFLAHSFHDTDQGEFRLACQTTVEKDTEDIICETFKCSLQIVESGTQLDVAVNPLTQVKNGKVYWGDELLDDYRGAIYGLAVDLGTTTVVMTLMDLEKGIPLYTASFENPQKYGGSDVLHRISYNNHESYKGRLHDSIISFINQEIKRLPINHKQIYELVIAGNATMRDIFFGLDVETIGVSPYKSLTQYDYEDSKTSTTSILKEAHTLLIHIHPHGKVYGLPLIGCHVGADTAAVALVAQIEREEHPVMIIDIGTNTEVVLGYKDRIIAASCPAGPAFEGGKIKFGMAGIEGAIETVQINDNTLQYHVIGDIKPKGICGSGLIDLLAELVRTQKMDELGRFSDGTNEFNVVPERKITFSRADISELAQAKSANIAGQYILIRKMGLTIDTISMFYLAGGFAWYINPANAREIGLIPPFPDEKIIKLGNASLEGAKAVLLNKEKRIEVENLVNKIEHIELEQESDFFDIFVEGSQFKPFEYPS